MGMNKREMAAWQIVMAIDEAIKDFGEKGVPEGHLYAVVMGKMDLETFQSIIDILTKSGRITRANHLLKSV